MPILPPPNQENRPKLKYWMILSVSWMILSTCILIVSWGYYARNRKINDLALQKKVDRLNEEFYVRSWIWSNFISSTKPITVPYMQRLILNVSEESEAARQAVSGRLNREADHESSTHHAQGLWRWTDSGI